MKEDYTIAVATEEGVNSRNKKCFLKCDGGKTNRNAIDNFFSIIMLGVEWVKWCLETTS